MNDVRGLVKAAAMLLLPLAPVAAQAHRSAPPALLLRADSAWRAGNRTDARVFYAEVLAADSSQSRAVFRLAQLSGSNREALVLYRRYVALEPGDAWGHMAVGDVLSAMGRWQQALAAYEEARAIAPGERDVAVGRARVLIRAGLPNNAADELARWTAKHPDDGEAWDMLGRARMQARRPQGATNAFEQAKRAEIAGASERLFAARRAAAPAITPEVASIGDSDGNQVMRFGGAIDFPLADGTRLGALLQRDMISGADPGPSFPPRPPAPTSGIIGNRFQLRLDRHVRPGANLVMQGGMTSFTSAASGSWTTLEGEARVRVRRVGQGPAFELRATRSPLAFNPELVANHAVRSEARVSLDAPVGVVQLRASGRLGEYVVAGTTPNARQGADLQLAIPLHDGRLQPSLGYRTIGFRNPSASGYFAPQRAETMEAGLYVESGDEGRLSVAADLGGGVQRVTEHGAMAGQWTRALRAWAQATLALAPSRAWFIEVEAYDAPYAPEGAGLASGSWRFLAVTSGLRWALR